jgi:hypothetical protein
LEIDPTRPIACDQGHDIIILTNTKFTRNKPFPIQKCTWESTIANQKKKKDYEKERSMTGRGKGEEPKANYPCCNTTCTLLLLTPSSPSICNPFYRFLPTSSLSRKGGKNNPLARRELKERRGKITQHSCCCRCTRERERERERERANPNKTKRNALEHPIPTLSLLEATRNSFQKIPEIHKTHLPHRIDKKKIASKRRRSLFVLVWACEIHKRIESCEQ